MGVKASLLLTAGSANGVQEEVWKIQSSFAPARSKISMNFLPAGRFLESF